MHHHRHSLSNTINLKYQKIQSNKYLYLDKYYPSNQLNLIKKFTSGLLHYIVAKRELFQIKKEDKFKILSCDAIEGCRR